MAERYRSPTDRSAFDHRTPAETPEVVGFYQRGRFLLTEGDNVSATMSCDSEASIDLEEWR